MVIFIGNDAAQANGTDKASIIDISAGIAIALRRNVSGFAKDIESMPPSQILDFKPKGGGSA
jgi:hypothetical protein